MGQWRPLTGTRAKAEISFKPDIAAATVLRPHLSRCDIEFDWTAPRIRAVVVLQQKETITMTRRTLSTSSRYRRRARGPLFLYVLSFAPESDPQRRPPRQEGPSGPCQPRPRPLRTARPPTFLPQRPVDQQEHESAVRVLEREGA